MERTELRGTHRWAAVALAAFFVVLEALFGSREPGTYVIAGLALLLAVRALFVRVVVHRTEITYVGWFRRRRWAREAVVEVGVREGPRFSAPWLRLGDDRHVVLAGLAGGLGRAEAHAELLRRWLVRSD